MLMCVYLPLLRLGLPTSAAKILTHHFRGRVVGAQHPLAVGERPLKQRDRLGRPPRILVGHREVVPRCQGGRVVGALQPLAVGERPLKVKAGRPGRTASEYPITAGWGVRWDAGEDHTTGTEAGMTVVTVEGQALDLFEPEAPDT